MKIAQRFNEATQLASTIVDWEDDSFSWPKAYVACVLAAIAYEQIPEFELRKTKRAKIIPCDSYQGHLARWETAQERSSIRGSLDTDATIEVVTRSRVLVAVSKLPKVIFVSLRGTTPCFADFKADLDFRKVKCPVGFGDSVKLHRGFFDAVLDCFDEVVERVTALNTSRVPVYITGHSLGAAMAAIFHARLDGFNFRAFLRNRHRIESAVSCYTFGMPRYGDMLSKARLPQPYHIFNELDAIPTVPPTFFGFVDSANERCLNAIPDQTTVLTKGNFGLRSGKGIATVLGLSDHRMERYLERLEVMRNR